MPEHLHPANVARHDTPDRGARIADRVTGYMGSWAFLGWQSVIIVVWVTLNVAAVALAWDPYPFILLNLVFSTQAAYAAPLILLAGNRSAEHDRARAEVDFEHNAESLDLLRQLADRHGLPGGGIGPQA